MTVTEAATATVFVSLDLSRRFDRAVLRGFSTVAKASGWHLWVSEWMSCTPTQARAADGWLFRSSSDPLFAEAAIRRRSVLVSGEAVADSSRVWGDDRAQGALAAEALASNGYRDVAFRGDRRYAAFRTRTSGFTDRARQLGLRMHSFDFAELVGRWTWMAERDLTRRLLSSLPRPIGIGVLDTLTAVRLAAQCREAGWAIGSDVGIVSTEHDELAAGSALPSIAGIDVGAERIGLRAGELLRRRLRGLPEEDQFIEVPPRGVVPGASLALQRAGQDGLAEALALIRNRGGDVSVDDLAARLRTTRRSIERHFLNILGHGPAVEIRRERLTRAAELLRDSDLPLAAIATTCGFGSTTALGRAFKAEWQISPMAWRRTVRAASGVSPARTDSSRRAP